MKQTYDVVLQKDGLREIVIDQFWRAHSILGAAEAHMLSEYYDSAVLCLDDLDQQIVQIRRGLKTLGG